MEKITLSPDTERTIVLSHLDEKSSLLISIQDIALMTGLTADTISRNVTKAADFPKPTSLSKKNLTFIAGDVIRWLKRNARHAN